MNKEMEREPKAPLRMQYIFLVVLLWYA